MGTECGIAVKNYNDVKPGDQIEVYERVEIARSIDLNAIHGRRTISRSDRIASQIQRELAGLIQRYGLKDPRLGVPSIHRRRSEQGSGARTRVTSAYSTGEDQAELCVEIAQSAPSGYLQREIGKGSEGEGDAQTQFRIYDDTDIRGQRNV